MPKTIEDLRQAPAILRDFLAHPMTRRSLGEHARERGDGVLRQQVMIGYSDSNKDGGLLASFWSLYQAVSLRRRGSWRSSAASSAMPASIPSRRRARAGPRSKLATARAMTFGECVERYFAAHKAGWRNEKHARQWKATLDTYAAPVFGQAPVQAVETALVMQVLDPIWNVKPETASRVRGRIEAVLDWATARGYRGGENPARWRGHLAALSPPKTKDRPVKHHPAMPYAQVPGFMAALRAQDGVAALELRFAVLTAARTNKGDRRAGVKLEAAVWTIPAERIKAAKEHRLPLSEAALEVIDRMRAVRCGDYVFPGGKEGRPLSTKALLALLKRMGLGNITVHGVRSSFRDWAAEQTSF